jgi:hypothetical protein
MLCESPWRQEPVVRGVVWCRDKGIAVCRHSKHSNENEIVLFNQFVVGGGVVGFDWGYGRSPVVVWCGM